MHRAPIRPQRSHQVEQRAVFFPSLPFALHLDGNVIASHRLLQLCRNRIRSVSGSRAVRNRSNAVRQHDIGRHTIKPRRCRHEHHEVVHDQPQHKHNWNNHRHFDRCLCALQQPKRAANAARTTLSSGRISNRANHITQSHRYGNRAAVRQGNLGDGKLQRFNIRTDLVANRTQNRIGIERSPPGWSGASPARLPHPLRPHPRAPERCLQARAFASSNQLIEPQGAHNARNPIAQPTCHRTGAQILQTT